MAYLDEDTRRRGQEMPYGKEPGAPTVSVGAPVGSPTPQGGDSQTGATPIAAYFSANQPQAEEMAAHATDDIRNDIRGAVDAWDPNAAQDVKSRLDATATPEGVSGAINSDPRPDYSAGMGALDSYLTTRGGAGAQFDDLRERFSGNLDFVGTPKPGADPARPEAPTNSVGYDLNDPATRARLNDAYAATGGDAAARQRITQEIGAYTTAYQDYQNQLRDWENQYGDTNAENQQQVNDWDSRYQQLLAAFGGA
jgi:hypothetical protein